MNKDNSLIINKIKSHYGFTKDVDFAKFLGITPQSLSNWYSRNTFDYELVYTKCLDIDANWLLTGIGDMLKTIETAETVNKAVPASTSTEGIPLIPINAMAGQSGGDIPVMEYESERFVVPTFKGADFLISVRGSSMYPKYNSGDIVACKRLSLDAFFQWNKIYVLDTEQGALIKRVRKGKDEDHVLIFSDNKDYDPFDIHRRDIRSLAIVLGVIRLE